MNPLSFYSANPSVRFGAKRSYRQTVDVASQQGQTDSDTLALSSESQRKIRKVFHNPSLSLHQDSQGAERVAELAEKERQSDEQLQAFGTMLSPNIPEPEPSRPITPNSVKEVLWKDLLKLQTFFLIGPAQNAESGGNHAPRKRSNSF